MKRKQPSKKIKSFQRIHREDGARWSRSTRHYGLNETNNRPSNTLCSCNTSHLQNIIISSRRSLSQMLHPAHHLFFTLSFTPISLVNNNSLLYLATAIEDLIISDESFILPKNTFRRYYYRSHHHQQILSDYSESQNTLMEKHGKKSSSTTKTSTAYGNVLCVDKEWGRKILT